jgi:hypothetical protein
MAHWTEIQDAKEIRKLNQRMGQVLESAVSRSIEKRTIGSPDGRAENLISFIPVKGGQTFWFRSYLNSAKGKAFNLFGHGEPGEKSTVLIGAQFNFSIKKFNRMSGGVFLLNRLTNKIFLAHRGIVTLGHARLNQSKILIEAAKSGIEVVKAETGTWEREYMIVCDIESKVLVRKLSTFTHLIRQTAKRVASQDTQTTNITKKMTKREKSILDKLNHYSNEFSGQMNIPGRSQSTVDRTHGKIVDALKNALKFTVPFNSKAIDLAVFTKTRSFLFEIKTSANTQSVYTAMGQLLVHEPTITNIYRGLQFQKVIVLPEIPHEYLMTALKRCQMSLVTYTSNGKLNYEFGGIEHLVDGS